MPPTPDEIAAAEARLRRLAAGEPNDTPCFFADPEGRPAESRLGACRYHDCRTLADAWLAANPADDSLPIDAEWLDANEGRQGGGREWAWPVPAEGAALRVWPSGYPVGPAWRCQVEEADDGESVALPSLATRGQLRRLLAALGVPPAVSTDPTTPTE